MFKLIIAISILLCLGPTFSFGSSDTKYYHKFKATGFIKTQGNHKLPSSEKEKTQTFYGALKRVVHKDESEGTDVFFFAWEEKSKTWSPGFYFGSKNISNDNMQASSKFQSKVSIRHFGDQELDPVLKGDSKEDTFELHMVSDDLKPFSLLNESFPSESYTLTGKSTVTGQVSEIKFTIYDVEKMSTPGFLFHFIMIAYVWQCLLYFFLGRGITTLKELPVYTFPMSIYLFMEAFNIYSKTVFEDKTLLRTLVSILMGLNFLIILIPNRKILLKEFKELRAKKNSTEGEED